EEAVKFLANVASSQDKARTLAAPRVAAARAAAADQEGVVPPTPEELAAELAVSATWGLALSGTQRAEAALNALRTTDAAPEPAKQLAEPAAKMNQAVRPMGRQQFLDYRTRHLGQDKPR